MKKFLLLTSALCLTSTPVLAADYQGDPEVLFPNTGFSGEFSANVGFVTEYSFRGIDQNDEGPAIQGGFDYSHDNGFYAGIWGSNVDFNDGDEANVEVDIYAGLSGTLNNVAWDIGGIYYAYPGADSSLDYDFFEAAVALGYDFGLASVTGSVNYSPDFFGSTGDAVYSAAYVDVPLAYDFTLNTHIGYQEIDEGTDYTDWSVGLSYSYANFDFSINYIDTDLDEPNECADGCEERIIFGISRSF